MAILDRAKPPAETMQWVKFLLYGSFGVGKTYLAATAPKALMVDCEGGTLSIPRDKKIDIIRITNYTELAEIFWELKDGKHRYETVVIDSLTEVQKRAMDEILMTEYEKNPSRRDPDVATLTDWGKNTQQMRKAVRSFRDLDMHVVFTALESESKDERDGSVTIVPTLTPKLSTDVCGYVDIVGRLVARQNEKKGETERVLLTAPDTKHVAKDRSGALGAQLINPSFEDILKKIRGGK